jgi:hypothetical protein
MCAAIGRFAGFLPGLGNTLLFDKIGIIYLPYLFIIVR